MKSPKFWSKNHTRDLALARELLLGVQAAGVSTYRQSISLIAAELRRCRRYERPLSVLAVPGAGGYGPSSATTSTLSGRSDRRQRRSSAAINEID